MATAPTATNSTITGNSSSGPGGAIDGITSGTTTSISLTNTTVSGNTGTVGGGIYGSGGDLTLTNVTVTGNSATTNGGGIDSVSATPTVTNSIVAGNTIAHQRQRHCHTTRHVQPDRYRRRLRIDHGNDNQVDIANPGLGTLGDYGGPTKTIPLLSGSPAIHAGTSTNAPSTDQRVIRRLAHSRRRRLPGSVQLLADRAVDQRQRRHRPGSSIFAVPSTWPIS